MAKTHAVTRALGALSGTLTSAPKGFLVLVQGTGILFQKLAVRLLDQLNEETRSAHAEADADACALLAAGTPYAYRRFLLRLLGFVRPLERALADTPGLDSFLDARRLQKHLLLEADLQALGVRAVEIESFPECMFIPLFEDPHEALGWAYIEERSTLAHPDLYRHLGSLIPGEIAFASSYLKCYFGAVGEMWQSFGNGLEAAAQNPRHASRIIEAAKAGFRRQRRWRRTLDGQAVSGTYEISTIVKARPSEQPDLAPPEKPR